MKWDIDKTVRNLVAKRSEPHVSLSCTFLNPNRLAQVGLCPRTKLTLVWVLTFGHAHGPQKTFYGFSIHEACLRATKFLKSAKPLEIESLGVTKPKKRGHYLRKTGKKRQPSQDTV